LKLAEVVNEVKRRIALGQEAFSKKRDLMRRSFSINLWKWMLFVWSIAL